MAYVNGGAARSVRARGVVLACWYSMIPYLCDELPGVQKQAMRFMTRIPMVYASVAIRSWRAFERLGLAGVYTTSPRAFWSYAMLDDPVSMGGYEYSQQPRRAGAAALLRLADGAGHASARGREGRPLEALRHVVRRHRAGDPRTAGARSRRRRLRPRRRHHRHHRRPLGHGYSFEYASPWDNAFYPDGPLPGEVAARPFGRIVMAGTDKRSEAYMDSAIDAAHEAVSQL